MTVTTEPPRGVVAPRTAFGGVPLADLALLGGIAALAVVWAPGLFSGLTTPRLAVLLAMLGPGAVVLVGLVRRGDVAARWAAGYLVWALVAALASGAVRISLVASIGIDRGWVVLTGYVGIWALGRRLGVRGRRLLPAVLIGAVSLSASVAVLQAAFHPGGALEMVDGRANGLTSSSVYLGGQVGAALVLAAALAGRAGRRWLLALPACTLFALTANLSGSRSALVITGPIALAAVIRWSRRATAGPPALVRIAAVVAAIALGVGLSFAFDLGGAGTSRLEQGASGSSGFGARATMWRAGVAATGERPLTGWGPGRFRAATAARTTAEFARAEGPDRLYFDAHNVLVEHLTTTGIVGLVLLGGFAVAVARQARGPLAWFGAAMVAIWMLSPVSVATGPLALFALGAAMPRPPPGPGSTVRAARLTGGVLASLGLLAGASMLTADRLAEQASTTGSVDLAVEAQRYLPPDDTLADLEALARRRVATVGPAPATRAAALEAARRPIALDPTRPTWWVHLGYAEANVGTGTKAQRLARADAAFREALERNPWSAAAMDGLVKVAHARGDRAAEARWRARLCRVVTCA